MQTVYCWHDAFSAINSCIHIIKAHTMQFFKRWQRVCCFLKPEYLWVLGLEDSVSALYI